MEDFDGITERQDTITRMPLGWLIFFIGVIVWGIWYMFMYVPLGEYSQHEEYAAAVAASEAAAPKVPVGKNPYIGNADEVEEGRAIYAENCSMCHGEGGDESGGNMGVPLVGIGGYMSDAEQFEVVMKGRADGGMPAFENSLGSRKVWEVLAYIDTLGK